LDEFAAPAIAGYAVDSISAQRFAKFGDDGTVVVGNLLESTERGSDGQSSISQGQILSGGKANTLRYVRIPMQAGRGFRFHSGPCSELMPATIPK
jgi:hypothetical protein